MAGNETLAGKLHDGTMAESTIDSIICDAFEKYEPEIYEKLDFSIGSDYYDNSIEIYFKISLPYPYEPCKEIRDAVYECGFSIVFWNFLADTQDVICDRFVGEPERLVAKSPDEIRGWEPRHNKNAKWKPTKYGYVDDRFNEDDWLEKYGNKRK